MLALKIQVLDNLDNIVQVVFDLNPYNKENNDIHTKPLLGSGD